MITILRSDSGYIVLAGLLALCCLAMEHRWRREEKLSIHQSLAVVEPIASFHQRQIDQIDFFSPPSYRACTHVLYTRGFIPKSLGWFLLMCARCVCVRALCMCVRVVGNCM